MATQLYTPIIKGKFNDLKALGFVSHIARSKIKPLVEVMPLPKKQPNVEAHLYKFAANLQKLVPLGEIYVDFSALKPGLVTEEGRDAVIAGFDFVKGLGRIVTPVYVFGRDDTLWPLLRHVCQKHDAGFCFRLTMEDIEDLLVAEDTWAMILERSGEVGVQPGKIDLIIDLEDIREKDQNEIDALQTLVLDFLFINPTYKKFRSIAIVGSSALKTVSSIPEEGSREVLRNELILWLRLQKDFSDSLKLVFGDYGVVHPQFSDQGSSKNVNAKIRYTSGRKISYFRGHRLHHPEVDYFQYYDLAKRVKSSDIYKGPQYSVGDGYINIVANQADSPGNLAKWVVADMNHHLEYTTHQIESMYSLMHEVQDEEELLGII
jgi:hypothetical protein